MNSLRALGDFVGLPQDASELGYPSDIGLRGASDLLAPVMVAGVRGSLRALLATPPTLRPVELSAQLLNPSGQEPHAARIRVVGSPALVLSTRIAFVLDGREYPSSQNYGAAGGDFTPTSLSPGTWTILVRRSGIGPTGLVRLERAFVATVSRRPAPPPPPPPPPPRPQIAVASSGAPEASTLLVTGSGFLPGQPAGPQGITIRLVDGVNVQDWLMQFAGSDGSGAIHHAVAPVNTLTLARNAAGQAMVHVSATDQRRDPNSVPANEPLWSNTVTLQY